MSTATRVWVLTSLNPPGCRRALAARQQVTRLFTWSSRGTRVQQLACRTRQHTQEIEAVESHYLLQHNGRTREENKTSSCSNNNNNHTLRTFVRDLPEQVRERFRLLHLHVAVRPEVQSTHRSPRLCPPAYSYSTHAAHLGFCMHVHEINSYVKV